MSTVDERDVNPVQEMIRIAQSILDLPSRKFLESYRSPKPGKIIFDSEWCRLSMIWGGWDYGGGNSMQIRYGRLHAPNEQAVMLWNAEECHCWHRPEHALHFLDGRKPADAAELNYSHPITSPFYSEEIRTKYRRRQPEWIAQMHLVIWQNYGTRLFELFDLRRSDLWQQYQKYLTDLYDIAGRIPEIKPPLDKVC